MTKFLSIQINCLISLLFFISSNLAFATVAVKGGSFSAQLPRSLSASSIKVKFTLQYVPKEDVEQSTIQTIAGNVKIYLIDVNSSIEVPDEENSSINFTKTLSESDSQTEQDDNEQYYDVTLGFEIRETKEGELNKAISSKKLRFSIQYKAEEKLSQDSGGKPLEGLVSAPIQDSPKIEGVYGGFRSIGVSWQTPTSVTLKDGSSASPTDISLVVIQKKDRDSLTVPAKKYSPQKDTDDGTECQINLNLESGSLCDSCQDQNTYFDLTEIKSVEGVSVVEVSDFSKGSTTLGGLEVSKDYLVLAQYGSTGLARSSCFSAVPYVNFSMSEYFEGGQAKQDDLSCFIATAAYGTSFSSELYLLRWFRDKYLKSNSIGSWFVKLYYKYSPPVAKYISEHPICATIVRALLFVPVKICSLLFIMSLAIPTWLSLILVVMFMILIGLGCSRIIRFTRK